MNPSSEALLLIGRIEGVLGSGMGAALVRRRPEATSARVMLEWLALYGLTWAAIAFSPGSGRPQLVSLLAWGGFYFAGAVYVAQKTTEIILETVKRDIIPHASKDYLANVAAELEKRYPKDWQRRLPLLAALVALALAVVAIRIDLLKVPAAGLLTVEFLFWAATYFLFFYTAALSVAASRFYLAFADLLEEESGSFYVWGAADSPLVKGLATLARQVLTFMAIICVLLASAMSLAILPWPSYALGLDSLLLVAMVPASCFFSLGYGSLVYLQAEARIRSVLRRFTIGQAALLQKNNKLVRSGTALSPAKAEQAERLTRLHDQILAGGRYGSRLGTGVSVALPLIMPIISLIFKIVSSGSP